MRYDANQPAQLYKYAKKYAQYWYQYFNGEEGREMRNGCLYLVTGCDKCHSWEAACFHPPRRSSVFPIAGVAEVGGAFSHSREVQTGPSHRIHRRDTTDPDQAIFLRGYTISVREKPTVHEQLLAKKPTDTVIGGSKAKGSLIVSPVPYGVESPFRRGIPVGEMDTYGESVGVMLYHPSFSRRRLTVFLFDRNSEDSGADFSDGNDSEDPEDVKGSSQVEIFAIGHGHNVYNPSAKINAYIFQNVNSSDAFLHSFLSD